MTGRKLGELYILDQLKMSDIASSNVDLSDVASNNDNVSSFRLSGPSSDFYL